MIHELAGVIFTSTLLLHSATAMTPDQALRYSTETGRPILAMATSDTCPPCQKLKHNVYTSPQLRDQIAQCVVLEIDAHSPEFRQFSSQFPVPIQGVPVVYFIRPDRRLTYGQTGMLSVPELQVQLTEILGQAGAPPSDEQIRIARHRVETAKQFLARNDPARALRLSSSLIQMKNMAAPIQEAHVVRGLAIKALYRRLEIIETRIHVAPATHGAAYRLAEVFAESASVPELRKKSREMLVRFQQNEVLRPAVHQGMELVKARLHERRNHFPTAIAAYQRIIALDPASPSSQHAKQKIRVLTRRAPGQLASAVTSRALKATAAPDRQNTLRNAVSGN